MIRHIIGMAVIAGLSFTAAVHAEDKWETFSSKSGKYSISLPSKPMETDKKIDSAAGELTIYMALVAPNNDLAYLVTYNDYPDAALAGAEKDAMLDGVRDGNVKSFGGKVASEKKITLGKEKYPGREILLEKPGETAVYRARMYLVNNRLYQVVIVSTKDVATNKDTDNYFESFKLSE
jgi:hypothetical protein